MTGPRFTRVEERYPETNCLVDIRYKNIHGNYWTVPGAFFWNGATPCFIAGEKSDIHQIVSWRKRG